MIVNSLVFMWSEQFFPTVDGLKYFLLDLSQMKSTAGSTSLFMRRPLILNKNSLVEICE